MATLQIQFKDKKFISHNGVNVEKDTDTHIIANGWECKVDERGNFYCIATKFYYGERRQIKFKIKDGNVKLLLKIGNEKPKALKSYKLEKWPIDGVIGLPGGVIDKRRAYFRESDFQNFLDEYGITSVRYESANGIYLLLEEIQEGESCFKEIIESDGNIELIFNDVEYPEDGDGQSFVIRRQKEVTNATWVIKKVRQKTGLVTHKILFTTDNPKKIKGLPKD